VEECAAVVLEESAAVVPTWVGAVRVLVVRRRPGPVGTVGRLHLAAAVNVRRLHSVRPRTPLYYKHEVRSS